MSAPIHIFKAGEHCPMSGEVMRFTQADLQATIQAYDPALHEAPLVIGHPKHNKPAWGWVARLTGDGNNIYAVAKQMDPAFAETVRSGRYKKRSASFYAPDSPIIRCPASITCVMWVGWGRCHRGLRDWMR